MDLNRFANLRNSKRFADSKRLLKQKCFASEASDSEASVQLGTLGSLKAEDFSLKLTSEVNQRN